MKTAIAKHMYIFSLSSAVLIFLFLLISDYIIELGSPNYSWKILLFLVIALILGVILFIALTIIDPYISELVLSTRKFQRIENLSSPLLLKLSTEAPGTFHHSLNVSNLAQRAAKSIGADSLLIRTAAFYHDIGKLKNPTLFIENQGNHEIPHNFDEQSIKKSAEAIIAHAMDGVLIAQKNGLPEEIIDLIAQHHGTTRALYFYEKAKEQGIKIQKTDFRYPGPVPLTKEAAILMLADSVEATARAFPNLTRDKISEIVKNTVEDKFAEKQLKNSGLTEEETASIRQSLENTLFSIYHQRIAYTKNDQA